MAENIESTHKGRLIAYAVLAAAVAAGGIFGITQLASYAETTTSSSGSATPTDTATPQEGDVVKLTPSTGNKVIPEMANGQEAIDSLGDNITVAAERNDMTVDELTALLLRDPTAHVSSTGRILYIDTNQKLD